MKISVVSPVFNAEKCIAELCHRLKSALLKITEDFEIILVEDRSLDDGWALIQNESRKDSRVHGIRLAKNFGQHRAITAGLELARGDWVIVMDCDLQDPPEAIPLLYAKACEGYEVVVAQFDERAESTIRQKVSKTFWRGLSWLAGISFDHRIGNFRIMSRRVVVNFLSYREQLRFLGGITSLMGFTTTFLSVKRSERFAGKTSYTFKKLLNSAIEIAVAYSDKPLRLSVFFGLAISGLAIITGLIIVMLSLSGRIEISGWASVMVSIYLLCGLIIANLGLMGYYIGKIFDETKRRPLYVVESTTHDCLGVQNILCSQIAGSVLWITGLSGAGKSTLAHEVVRCLRAEGKYVVMLDGDDLRTIFGTDEPNMENYGREGRLAIAIKYSHLCRLIASQGVTVVIATISLFREIHDWNRANLPGYFEVYLKVPLEELRRRDSKGIYQRFDAGEIKYVAGLDLPIDEPKSADWVVDFSQEGSVLLTAENLIKKFRDKIV